MASNFAFLNKYWPVLARLGEAAEMYLDSDPNASLFKSGAFAEQLVQEILKQEDYDLDSIPDIQSKRIGILKRDGIIPYNVANLLHTIRLDRNDSVHNNYDDRDRALVILKMIFNLANWFMEVYGDWDYKPKPFITPVNEMDENLKAKEAEIARLQEELKNVKATTSTSNKTSEERKQKAEYASESMDISEAETRMIIDNQLRQVGWEADTTAIRYSNGVRPQKGKNLAIAEWPTDSTVYKNGFADYALFKGLDLVGIVEAKKASVDIPAVIDDQCKEYASLIKPEHMKYVPKVYGKYKVPFVFATNGRPYIKQLETKSGIWFQDLRGHDIPKALRGWISPRGIDEILKRDQKLANSRLENTPLDILRDPNGLNLRYYQIDAIEAAEKAIVSGRQQVLLSMATGTGKTRTILGLIYRLLESKRFNRILFLVDRTALGDQAIETFESVKIADLLPLTDIYNVQDIKDKNIDSETSLQIATVQGMVQRVLFPEDKDKVPSVTDYDLIIADEAHRGYVLDRELSETDLFYRSEKDFVSKYRAAMDYFEAVKIGLTATPALHTTDIFGEPVFEYSYRDAVVDGYLVDHDAPHELRTKLNTDGIKYKKGESIPVLDPNTNTITNSGSLPDDVLFDVGDFNKKIITESFNRVVLEEISNYLNPEGDEKTLIYAVNDAHADLIVKILKEIYSQQGIDTDAIRKITGKSEGGDKKKIEQLIKKYKNERFPNIAVTVDLLTTGIDVPKICNLVFMRRVKSRVLFEQMLGRATRLCPEINKSTFQIFDPVREYEILEDFSAMKPVVANVSRTFVERIDAFPFISDEKEKKAQYQQFIAKLERKAKNLKPEDNKRFGLFSEKDVEQTAVFLREVDIEIGLKFLYDHKDAFAFLDTTHGLKKGTFISDREDELTDHFRGYGDGQKPEDYIQGFKSFLRENEDRIEALKIICTRPKDLTRESLKQLKRELDKNNYSEQQLNSALNEMKNEDILVDIIGLIRNQVLGSDLITHEQRVRDAFKKLRENNKFNKIQSDWMSRLEKTMIQETAEPILDHQTFNTGAFQSRGGFDVINKQFKGTLDDMISQINEYMYLDGGIH